MKARSASPNTDAPSYRVLIAAIVALALVLRLPGITDSVWYDELSSTRVVLGSVRALMFVIATDAHPPFYAVVMFVWIRVFGDSEISIRIFPMICGLLTIVLTARLAVAYGGPRAGPVAAFILAISPPHIWYSQEARQYSFLLLLVTSCTWAFHRIRQSHETRWYVAYAIAALCMVLTHYFAVAYLAAFTLLALPDRRARARMLWIGGAIAIVLASYLAVRWSFSSLPTRLGHLRGFGISGLWTLMFEWFVIGGALGRPGERAIAVQVGVLVIQLMFFALMLRGLSRAEVTTPPVLSAVARWEALARRWELALLLLILPLGLVALGLLGAKKFYVERSALSALPFFAIAVGIGVASFQSALRRALTTALIACFGTVVLLNFYTRTDRFTVYYPNPDWRAAAQWLRQRSLPGRRIVAVSLTPADELLYYDRGFGLIDTRKRFAGAALSDDRRPGSMRERLRLLLSVPVDTLRGRTGRIYLLNGSSVSLIDGILAREQVSEFFVVTNRFLVNRDRVRDALAADPSFNIEEVFEPKGVRLTRVRRTTGVTHVD